MIVVPLKSAAWLEWLVWQINHICQLLLLHLLLLRIQKCHLCLYVSGYVLPSNFGYVQQHNSMHSALACAALFRSDPYFIGSFPKFIHFKAPGFSFLIQLETKLGLLL